MLWFWVFHLWGIWGDFGLLMVNKYFCVEDVFGKIVCGTVPRCIFLWDFSCVFPYFYAKSFYYSAFFVLFSSLYTA